MKIKQLRILNYKGFLDSKAIPVGANSSVIVGQNNAGKTALLEVFASFKSKPYKGPRDDDGFFPIESPRSYIEIEIVTSGKEILRQFLSSDAQLEFLSPHTNNNENNALLTELFGLPEISWTLERDPSGWRSSRQPSLKLRGVQKHRILIRAKSDRRGWTDPGYQGDGGNETWVALISAIYEASTFIFRAERMNIGVSAITKSDVLQPNASNLPSALLQLQGRAEIQEKYLGLVREIFPNILGVASKPISENQAGIFVTNRDGRAPSRAAIELALDDCGTGISQVLAILYVAVTAESPKVIIIDEPNSFLHPGAVRKLLDILKRFRHQYIVSTHSSDIINAIQPDVIGLVVWSDNQSKVEALDRAKSDDQRRVLDELGVKLSDIFGADNILWVEGVTEERCFPILLSHSGKYNVATSVIALVATGDLDAKGLRGDLALQVYDRLSRGTALVPPTLAISLDLEDRSPEELKDLVKRSDGLVRFLPRYAYENYLISAEALAYALNDDLSEGERVTVDDVEGWLEAHKADKKYYSGRNFAQRNEGNWQIVVDGPKLIAALFVELSGSKVIFRKTFHSPKLTIWLLQHRPELLPELLGYVESLVVPR